MTEKCYVCNNEIFVGNEDLCLNCYDHLQAASRGKVREPLSIIAPALVDMLRKGLTAATKELEKVNEKWRLIENMPLESYLAHNKDGDYEFWGFHYLKNPSYMTPQRQEEDNLVLALKKGYAEMACYEQPDDKQKIYEELATKNSEAEAKRDLE